MFDMAHTELSVLVKSFARCESFLLVLDSAHVDLSMLAQDFTRLESAVLISGLSCTGPVFALPVIDSATLGFTLFLRSLSCSDLSPFVLDANRLGLLMFPKDFARLDLAISVLGSSRVGSVSLLSVIDCGNPGPSVSLQSYSHSGFLPSLLDFSSFGLVASVRSFA